MKKIYFVILLLILLAGLLIALRGKEDDWICSSGQWVKHGNPASEKPVTVCK
jgi:hypothetical protein